METESQESDQRPEEAPGGQVPDDTGRPSKPDRETSEHKDPPQDDQATGNTPEERSDDG